MDVQVEWSVGKAPKDFNGKLESFQKEFLKRLRMEAQAITVLGVQLAKRKAPVDTGELRDSIRGEVDRRMSAIIAKISATADHAPFQEFGTIHQGAQPYLRPTLEQLEPLIAKRTIDAWKSAIKAVS